METGKNPSNPGGASAEDRALESLLRRAASRPVPSPGDRRSVESAVRDEWRQVVAKRQWRRRIAALSIAASLTLVVVLALWNGRSPPGSTESVEVALVERISGRVSLSAAEADGRADTLATGMRVRSSQRLQTARGSGIALRLKDGLSLRVDQDSVVEIVAPLAVRLLSGRVFVDTGSDTTQVSPDAPPAGRFEILTAAGIVRHVGTQYMVRADDELLRVSVRRGDVRVVGAVDESAPILVSVGQQLSLTPGGKAELAPTDVYGDQWRWAEELGSGFALDGRTMDVFLAWVARETGLELKYLGYDARVAAEQTVLHGTVDLPAREALDVVIMSSDLAAEVEGGVIEVSIRR